MRDYFIRRFLLLIPTLIGITLVTFFITRIVPGGPIERAIAEASMADSGGGGGAGENSALSDEQLDQLREFYGLDKPWYQAYVIWLGKVVQGDLGDSYRYQEPVTDIIFSKFPVSIYYGLVTLFITYLVCVPLGILKAIKHRTHLDNISSILVFGAYAIPGYALGALLVVFMAARWEWFPMGGFRSDDYEDMSRMEQVKDVVYHSILPLICYLVHAFAFVTMLMKNHLMDNLAADYIRTAVAKGNSFRKAVVGHAMRNSMIPLATYLGGSVTLFVTGSFLIETIFDIDGFGLLGYTSIIDRDYPVVMGVLLITAFLILLGNILSDMLVALVDPRVRFK